MCVYSNVCSTAKGAHLEPKTADSVFTPANMPAFFLLQVVSKHSMFIHLYLANNVHNSYDNQLSKELEVQALKE